VTHVDPGTDSVVVTFRIDEADVKVPSDVSATIVPISLLGERYVQLFPAYRGGPALEAGSNIPLRRTSVPAEGDELLAAMQDYMGEIDGDTVEEFVTNAADVLEGKGARLNRLIVHGTEVVATLDSRRDELANMVVQFDKLARALATRQDAMSRLINSYNAVGATVNEVRGALEGTITGLSDASAELADLLIDHRGALGTDIRSLTKTARTLDKNVDRFARTGKWAEKLFLAASRAIDFDRHWLRLGNQGAPLVDMILHRLEDRLVGVCLRIGARKCQGASYWEARFPELFCSTTADCAPSRGHRDAPSPDRTLDRAVEAPPDEIQDVIDSAANRQCKEAKHPKRCRKKKQAAEEAQEDGDLVDDLDDIVGGVIDGLGGDDDGGVLP
jgi:phospholipid/cholesterol/gamma-HCH transport system substrate-binding protein